MAQVKYGSIITDIKGKIGGQTFKGNFTAPDIHNITKPRKQVTLYNQAARSRMAYISSGWKELTESQRYNWNLLAATWPFVNCFGATYYATGFQCFSQANNNLLFVGRNLLTEATMRESDFLFTGISGAWTNDPDTCTFTFDHLTELGNYCIIVSASPTFSPGQYHIPSKLGMIDIVPNGNLTDPYVWSYHYTTRFIDIPSNLLKKKIMLQFKPVNILTGQASPSYNLFLNSPT